MASQSKKLILDGIVTQISTAVAALKLVTDEMLHPTEISDGQFPACIVYDGGGTTDYYVTQSISLYLNIFVQIIGDADTTSDGMRDLDEAIIDAINADVQIGGLCHKCLVADESSLIHWDDTRKYHTRRYICEYRRDVP